MPKDKPKQKSLTKSKQSIKRKKFTFSVEAQNAKKVILMGDFNNWNPEKHPMKLDGNGLWRRAVIIPPGRYEYKFLVDGKWTLDPRNCQNVPNCFGTYNSVLNVAQE